MLERVTPLPRLRPSNPSDPARGQASDFGLVADARLLQDDSVSQRRLHTAMDYGYGTLFMRYEVQATGIAISGTTHTFPLNASHHVYALSSCNKTYSRVDSPNLITEKQNRQSGAN